jgi:hypothetical protein
MDFRLAAALVLQSSPRLLGQVRPDCADWVEEKSVARTVNGQRIKTKVWSRLRPRGNFTNLKTEGRVGWGTSVARSGGCLKFCPLELSTPRHSLFFVVVVVVSFAARRPPARR